MFEDINDARVGIFAKASVDGPVPGLARPQKPIRAELVGAHKAMAGDYVAVGSSPVIKLCRQLVAAGYEPAMPLEAYRGDTLCLRVRSIGEAAQLEVHGSGIGFRPCGGSDVALAH